MAESIKLSREWKQSLTADKYQPFAMQVSLFDLMFFYNKDKQLCVRYLENASPSDYRSIGYELPHNTIVFDPEIYKIGIKSRIIDTDNITFEKFSQSGIDLAQPIIDFRSKPLFLSEKNVEQLIPEATISDLDAIITMLNPKPLSSSDYFSKLGVKGLKIWDKDSLQKPDNSYDFYSNSILAKKIKNESLFNTWEDYPEPWIIGVEDDYDKNDGNGKLFPQNSSIILSSRDNIFEKRFLKLTNNDGIDNQDHLRAYNTICANYTDIKIWRNLYYYYNSLDWKTEPDNIYDIIPSMLSITNQQVDYINPVVLYLLKHCYLWIKASFFADYVDYRDFNQSLNQKSKTIFNNLMLTDTGNYQRYEEYFTNDPSGLMSQDKVENTLPYIPITTPSIDNIRNRFTQTSNLISGMQELIENGDDPDSKIGALPIYPFEMYQKDSTAEAIDRPPSIWFDPESRKEASDYNDFPIIYPKDGNAIIDGRIISPTIDEIWQMIKEMAAGRKPDTDPIQENAAGYPIGEDERKTTFDSRPTLKNHKFLDQSSQDKGKIKFGDPLDIKYEIENNIQAYKVMKWVNTPSKIQYTIIDELKEINNAICNNEDPNFIFASINNMPEPSRYMPSMTVQSLRELEALLKGLRWNFAHYIQYMMYNGVYNGKLGRQNQDTEKYNSAKGSLYQLHKDYSTTISGAFDHPNTVYDARKTLSPTNIAIKGIGLGKITDDMFGESQDKVPAHTVFLSAAGTWQSVSQCINLRIRTDEIF